MSKSVRHLVIDENICYSSRELIKNIFDDAYENVDLSNQYNSIIVLIDNQKFYTVFKSCIKTYLN